MSKLIYIVIIVMTFSSSCHISKQSFSLQKIPADILGKFQDDYGIYYHITQSEWVQDASTKYHLLMYNNKDNYLIAKNDTANPTDGNLYTRIDIIHFENMQPWQWGYCLTVYKAANMKEAINTAAANRSNPMKGCNGYPFSRMKRE